MRILPAAIKEHPYVQALANKISPPPPRAPAADWITTLEPAEQKSWIAHKWTHAKQKLFFATWRIYYFFVCLIWGEPTYKIPELQMEKLFSDGQIEEMRKNYSGLGKEKWRESIDGMYHKHGKWVFDRGLHNGTVEPGFIISLEKNAYPLISHYLGTRTTTEFFLTVHRAACWHFKGDYTGTNMGTEAIGMFRGLHNHIFFRCSAGDEMTKKGLQEFADFKPNLGHVAWINEDKSRCRVNYSPKTQEEIAAHMTQFLNDFYTTIKSAKTRHEKIHAIGYLAKKMDWLHGPRDGSGRSAMLFLQKHLTEFIGHPGIFEDPLMMTTMPMEQFVTYIEDALLKWEIVKAS